MPVSVRQIADLHLLLKANARRIDHRVAAAPGRTRWRPGPACAQLRDAIAAKRLGSLLSWGQFGRLVDVASRTAEASPPGAGEPRLGTFVKGAFDRCSPCATTTSPPGSRARRGS